MYTVKTLDELQVVVRQREKEHTLTQLAEILHHDETIDWKRIRKEAKQKINNPDGLRRRFYEVVVKFVSSPGQWERRKVNLQGVHAEVEKTVESLIPKDTDKDVEDVVANVIANLAPRYRPNPSESGVDAFCSFVRLTVCRVMGQLDRVHYDEDTVMTAYQSSEIVVVSDEKPTNPNQNVDIMNRIIDSNLPEAVAIAMIEAHREIEMKRLNIEVERLNAQANLEAAKRAPFVSEQSRNHKKRTSSPNEKDLEHRIRQPYCGMKSLSGAVWEQLPDPAPAGMETLQEVTGALVHHVSRCSRLKTRIRSVTADVDVVYVSAAENIMGLVSEFWSSVTNQEDASISETVCVGDANESLSMALDVSNENSELSSSVKPCVIPAMFQTKRSAHNTGDHACTVPITLSKSKKIDMSGFWDLGAAVLGKLNPDPVTTTRWMNKLDSCFVVALRGMYPWMCGPVDEGRLWTRIDVENDPIVDDLCEWFSNGSADRGEVAPTLWTRTRPDHRPTPIVPESLTAMDTREIVPRLKAAGLGVPLMYLFPYYTIDNHPLTTAMQVDGEHLHQWNRLTANQVYLPYSDIVRCLGWHEFERNYQTVQRITAELLKNNPMRPIQPSEWYTDDVKTKKKTWRWSLCLGDMRVAIVFLEGLRNCKDKDKLVVKNQLDNLHKMFH